MYLLIAHSPIVRVPYILAQALIAKCGKSEENVYVERDR